MLAKSCFLLGWLLLTSQLLLAHVAGIAINNVTKELVAPPARHYQWYKDGARLATATHQRLRVTTGGAYTLETVDAQGRRHTAAVRVGVNAAGALVRIYTIGDSTVQTYAVGYYPRTGWGQVLPYFFQPAGVVVKDKAVGGTSSKSFYKQYWAAVRDSLVAGDYVFIQFGINDRNQADTARWAPTGGVFEGYLTKFVSEARAKGAVPVLVTTIRRNSWTNDTTVYDAYHDDPIAVRAVAQSLNVPLIDLDARAKVLLQSVGQAYATSFWYNNYLPGEYPNYPNGNADDVHFQEMGAIEMAKLVVDGLRALSADPRVRNLIPLLQPQQPVATTANVPAAGLLTHTTTYPPGVTVTLKAAPAPGHTFVQWTNAAGARVSTGALYHFVMASIPASYEAFFDASSPLTGALPTSLSGPPAFIAPNPFAGETWINMSGMFYYSIVSATGVVVETGVGNGRTKIGKNLGGGFFIVRVKGEDGQRRSYKIVKTAP